MDLISRREAIDEIEYELEMINSALDSITLDFNARERLRQRRGEAREILNSIQQLPSAQPESLVKESRTLVKDLVKDAISRQAAIDLAKDLMIPGADYLQHNQAIMNYEAELVRLPSAQPEPCDDAVSREAAIDAALSAFSRGLLASPDIRKLPSVQPEPQWIPCSERLPDMWDERYLVSLAWGGIGVMEYKSTGFHNYGSFAPVPIESITAWMPLPEPYREERRTDE